VRVSHVAGCIDPQALVAAPRAVLSSLAHWESSTPEATAICVYDPFGALVATWTYRYFAGAVSAAARELRLRIAPDETVILQVPNGIEYAAWFLGGILAGVRVCAVHPSSTPFELERVARDTGAKAIIGSKPLGDLVHREPALLPDCPPDLHMNLAAASQGSVVLQSSGTTGSPRLVRRDESALDADALGLAAAAGLNPADRVLIVVPLCHSYGVDLLVATILAGASLHVFERFEPAGVECVLRSGAASVLPGVPFVFELLARSAFRTPQGSLRLAVSAGSMLPERVHAEFLAAWGVSVGQLYGATELGTVAVGRPDTAGFDPASVGTPAGGASVRAVDPNDPHRVLPAGVEGELAVMTPSMLCEYVDATLSLADGYFLTGDLGRIDAMGRVYVTGRLKHLIDVGGLKVNPLEVERIIGEHPGIAQCALVPLQVSDTVARLRLLFIPREDASPTPDEIRAFARERLSPHKLPRVFQQVESLPRSATGKLLRHLLNEI
jgi:long-chain acyl-CoA synthetase